MLTDPRVFEDDHLPRELMHREAAVRTLSTAFQPAIQGDPAQDVLIAGPSGVGKTVLARHTLAKLDQFVDVPHAHIQCLGETTGAILRAALQAHPAAGSPAANTPVEACRIELRESIDAPYLVILDEAEGLPDTDALAELVDVPQVAIVVICHDAERWLARTPDRVRRSIDTQLHLDRYSVPALADILRARAIEGLRSNAVKQPQLRTIADEVAGVARHGIQTLRAAAELATDRGHSRILEGDVTDGFERAQRAIRQANLQSLPFHHQVLYAIIHEHGDMSAGELHRQYDAIAEEVYHGHSQTPIGRRARRYKLTKLQAYDLIEYGGNKQNRVYSVSDAGVEPLVDLGELNQQQPN